MPTFSSRDREANIQHLVDQQWDIVVIGGGITGAGIALEAVTKGLRVALVEKRDFAWGTSSRSTKLIHGGLRYLKQLDFNLVREVGRERNIVHRNARHIVRPEKLLLPIYRGGTFGRMGTSVGLWIYDFLADVHPTERRQMLNRPEVCALEPNLRQEGLMGGGLYYEYRTDDARLTIEVLKTAVEKGATCLNYLEVEAIHEMDNGKKVVVVDQLTGGQHALRTTSIINATGPWVDQVRSLTEPVAPNKIFLSNGLHLVFSGERLPITHSMYFDVPTDNRMIFCVTRNGSVYTGTTDVPFHGSPDHVAATDAEVDYILAAVNHMFPSVQLDRSDINSTWTGVRPLIYEDGKTASEMSRKDEVFISPNGMVSIAGGKLTGYRKMAERAVQQILELYAFDVKHASTETVSLSGCTVSSEEELLEQKSDLMALHQDIVAPNVVAQWYSRYGGNTQQVLSNFKDLHNEYGQSDYLPLQAEIEYLITQEMAVYPEDITVRRTSAQHFDVLTYENFQRLLPNEGPIF